MNEIFGAEKQNRLAEKLHELHHTGKTLVLANAWDCASAMIFESTGFEAVATTSSGISWSLGYRDVEHTPPRLMLEVIGRIANSIRVPLTADIEGGYYRDKPELFARFINEVIEAGAVGINLEDGNGKEKKLNEVALQSELIKIVNEQKKKKGVNLFLNARTDGMAFGSGSPEERVGICLERAEIYTKLGANGIFVPFMTDIKIVERVKRGILLPLNVLANKALQVKDLRNLGVERISVGGQPMLATLNLLQKIGKELRSADNWPALNVDGPTYPEVNGKFRS